MKRAFLCRNAFNQWGRRSKPQPLEIAGAAWQDGRAAMSHEIAKLILEQAQTFLERREAIKTAQSLGMPLNEIEEYLDWLEFLRQQPPPATPSSPPPKPQGQGEA